MSLLYHRAYSLTVGDTRRDALRASFSVKKTIKKEPNTAEIKIYNLAASSRDALKETGLPVILEAGYRDNIATIFSGDARTIDHVREGADWITVIRSGDGERAYQWAPFSASFAPGTAIADVALAAGKALSINLGNLKEALDAGGFRGGVTQYAHGYTAHGKASQELDKILRSLGFTWSIQHGAIQVLRTDASTVPGTAILLTPSSGLVGSPEHIAPDKKTLRKGTLPMMKFRALLQPQLRCGGVVEIRSQSVNGQFRVQWITYTGDTAGADWYVTGEGTPI